MNIGDSVIVRLPHRSRGKVGGWEWSEYPGVVVAANKRTVIVKYHTPKGGVKVERVARERVRGR